MTSSNQTKITANRNCRVDPVDHWLKTVLYTVNSRYSEHNLQQYFVHYMERFTILRDNSYEPPLKCFTKVVHYMENVHYIEYSLYGELTVLIFFRDSSSSNRSFATLDAGVLSRRHYPYCPNPNLKRTSMSSSVKSSEYHHGSMTSLENQQQHCSCCKKHDQVKGLKKQCEGNNGSQVSIDLEWDGKE